MQYSLVTVAHLVDLPLLKLQARSLSRYLDRALVRDIIVVDNSVNGAIPHDQLLSQYGKLPVRIIKAHDIATVRPGTYGWFSQQVYKLMVAQRVTTERYIILDAKNHLVKRLDRGMIEAADRRIRTGRHGYRRHGLQHYLQRCCQYLSIEADRVMDQFLPTTPPFIMITSIVRQLIAEIEQREKQAFADAFVTHGLTEFFLYGSYIVSQGHVLEEYYQFDHYMGTTLWREDDNEHMQQAIAHAKLTQATQPRAGDHAVATSMVFAVHRDAFQNMNAVTQQGLAAFWYDRRLFASYADALRFVRGCASTYARK